eukprot:350631-Chlamydomonas_euryale.AAC.11
MAHASVLAAHHHSCSQVELQAGTWVDMHAGSGCSCPRKDQADSQVWAATPRRTNGGRERRDV